MGPPLPPFLVTQTGRDRNSKGVSNVQSSSQPRLASSSSSSRRSSYNDIGKTAHDFRVEDTPSARLTAPIGSSVSSEHSCQDACVDPACNAWDTLSIHNSEVCSLQSCFSRDVCESSDCCKEETCIRPSDTDFQFDSSYYGNEGLFGHGYGDMINYDLEDGNQPMPCQWLETDQQCPVSASPAALSLHVNKDHIDPNAWMSCGWSHCDQPVESQHILEHVSQEHRPDQYVCLWQGCGYSFSNGEELASHMSNMHTTKLDCHWGGCDFALMDPDALKMHVNDEHLNMYFGSTLDEGNSEGDLSIAPSPRPDFNDREPAQSGSSKAVKSTSHTCLWINDASSNVTCGASFAHENDLQDHVERTHIDDMSKKGQELGPVSFICKWQGCGVFGDSHNGKHRLRKHLWTHTRCYWFECEHCKRRFNSRAPYENHVRMHTKERPFKCGQCSSAFHSKEALSNHLRTHTGEKHLACEVCGFQCANSSNLSKHRKTHKPPVHTCQDCGKAFCRPDSLKRHMLQHNKVTPQKRSQE